ncbi:nitrate- and nitrite sensing domain-containing protein [Actinomadura graeca]|uniref:histidine kinase n=1 Tax=Actinomadura graeca TaxID=2750812 RepID=A0ABX8R1E0_9ACTN|nr:nitrate- and nitrite sensing domain-containing protein [Actinomadura graeca]QXJ24678.1 nitrate- and nitrite sensing domain-containing protein [Actinomadura graeca]
MKTDQPWGDRPPDPPVRTAVRRPRQSSIRLKVAALLLVPLLSLVALWGYAASVTGGDALAQRRYHTLDRRFAPGGQGVLVELGKERLASAAYLGGPGTVTLAELAAQRPRLDAAVEFFRREATSDAARRATSAEMERRVADVLAALDGLGRLRGSVDARSVDRLTAINGYGVMVDAMHRLYDALVVIDDSDLYQWTLSTRAAGRAMELMQRENALVAGALAGGGRMTPAEHRLFVEMVGEQRWQWSRQRSLLDPRVYDTGTRQIFESARYRAFSAMEDRIADRTRGPLPVTAVEWQSAAQPLVLSVNAMVLGNSRRAGEHADDLGRAAYTRLGAVGGLGLLAVLVSVLLSLRFSRGFVRELVGLRGAAEELAGRRLPDVVERLRRDETVDVAAEVPPLEPGRTTEIARLADAFSAVQRTAVDAAVGQAELRAGISRIFLNIARRNQSLLHRQLTMLDGLESRAEADDLADLFRIDHLTTRMRRHAESLIILSGATPGRGWRRPVRVGEVLRAAVAEIEDYTRVSVLTDTEDGLVGAAVTDVVHLLAELLENATSFSPPGTEVRMMADRVGTGFAIEIEDRGLGVRPERLAEANRRLAEPPEFDLVDTDQLGLFVVARLAARHDVTVTLQRSPYGGVTAVVLLPNALVVPAEVMGDEELGDEATAEEAQVPVADAPTVHATPFPETTVVPFRDGTPAGRFATRPVEGVPAVPQLTGQATPWPLPPAPRPVPSVPSVPPPRPPVNPWSDDAAEPDPPESEPFQAEPFRAEPFQAGPPDAGPLDLEPATRPDGTEPGGGMPESGTVGGDKGHSAGTYAGLPRRVRQENLAPQLRKAPPPRPASEDGAVPGVARSPEEARSLMASIQQGWRRGLASDIGDEETR